MRTKSTVAALGATACFANSASGAWLIYDFDYGTLQVCFLENVVEYNR